MLRFRILLRIGMSRINAYALVKEFSAHQDFRKRFGGELALRNEIYNALKSLENAGYLRSTPQKPNGDNRLKNYYSITDDGRRVLQSARRLMRAHMREMSAVLSE